MIRFLKKSEHGNTPKSVSTLKKKKYHFKTYTYTFSATHSRIFSKPQFRLSLINISKVIHFGGCRPADWKKKQMFSIT